MVRLARFCPGRLARLGVLFLVLSAFSHPGRAAFQTCGGIAVDSSVIRCPNGAIPSYQPGNAPGPVGSPGVSPSLPPGTDTRNPLTAFFGVWHTNQDGIGYSASIDVPGAYLLDHSAGIAAGDLTIDANGFFVWNTLTGTSGPWIKGDAERPLVLLDEAGHRRWTLGLVDGTLIIDGPHTTYSGHR